MKIDSNFVDYYDSRQDGFSTVDDMVTYHRYTKACSASTFFKVKSRFIAGGLDTLKYYSSDKEKWSILFFIIGFCGDLHRGMIIKTAKGVDASYTLTGAIYIPSKLGITLTEEMRDIAFRHFKYPVEPDHRIFVDAAAPVLVIRPNEFQVSSVYKNPNLSDYLFDKAKSPVDAFEKISSFLSSNRDAMLKEDTVTAEQFWTSFNPFVGALFSKS